MSLIGGGLGLLLASLIVPGIAQGVRSFLPGMALSTEALIQGLVLAFLIGILVGIFPALRAMRLNIVDALGGR